MVLLVALKDRTHPHTTCPWEVKWRKKVKYQIGKPKTKGVEKERGRSCACVQLFVPFFVVEDKYLGGATSSLLENDGEGH